jgi:hypothetical protein
MRKVACLLLLIGALVNNSYSQCGTTNIAQGKTITYSSSDINHTAAQAVDGNMGTDWWPNGGSSAVEDQYLTVDLGQNYTVCTVTINFQDATHRASNYKVQTSTNGTSWVDQATITGNASAAPSHTFSATTRYVKVWMTAKAISWSSYSIVELQVFTAAANQSPTVSITSPANSASFTVGGNVVIDATATDADGTVNKVEFYQGATKLGEDLTSPYSFTWTSPAAGSYSLTAVATDNSTATTTSSPINITVNAASGGADWSLTGNTGTTVGTNFLGTTDNKDLVVKTNNVERVRVLSNGNVGIGVAAPGARLSLPDINASTEATGITWYSAGPLQYGIHKTDGAWAAPDYQQVRLGWLTGIILDPGNTYGKSFVDIQGNGLRVTGTSVGIGTTAPSTQLHTTGGVRFAGMANNNTLTRVLVSDANGNLSYRDASTLTGASTTDWSYNGNAVTAAVPFGTTSNWALPFITGGVERMRIGANGNVGIGTTSITDADYKLSVLGGIRARKVKVDQLTWSDYVFNKDYKLLSLEQVEQFIQQNKHLPGVPSAKEIEKQGLDVGDNQAVLLKKIEELTLYLIGQNKKLESQIMLSKEKDNRIDQLEKAVNDMKRSIRNK